MWPKEIDVCNVFFGCFALKKDMMIQFAEAISAYLLWQSSAGLAAVHLFCLILYGVR